MHSENRSVNPSNATTRSSGPVGEAGCTATSVQFVQSYAVDFDNMKIRTHDDTERRGRSAAVREGDEGTGRVRWVPAVRREVPNGVRGGGVLTRRNGPNDTSRHSQSEPAKRRAACSLPNVVSEENSKEEKEEEGE